MNKKINVLYFLILGTASIYSSDNAPKTPHKKTSITTMYTSIKKFFEKTPFVAGYHATEDEKQTARETLANLTKNKNTLETEIKNSSEHSPDLQEKIKNLQLIKQKIYEQKIILGEEHTPQRKAFWLTVKALFAVTLGSLCSYYLKKPAATEPLDFIREPLNPNISVTSLNLIISNDPHLQWEWDYLPNGDAQNPKKIENRNHTNILLLSNIPPLQDDTYDQYTLYLTNGPLGAQKIIVYQIIKNNLGIYRIVVAPVPYILQDYRHNSQNTSLNPINAINYQSEQKRKLNTEKEGIVQALRTQNPGCEVSFIEELPEQAQNQFSPHIKKAVHHQGSLKKQIKTHNLSDSP